MQYLHHISWPFTLPWNALPTTWYESYDGEFCPKTFQHHKYTPLCGFQDDILNVEQMHQLDDPADEMVRLLLNVFKF